MQIDKSQKQHFAEMPQTRVVLRTTPLVAGISTLCQSVEIAQVLVVAVAIHVAFQKLKI